MHELINTLEHPGEFDALPKLKPGEPYFVLIGRDRHAPKLVEEWADHNRRRALADEDISPDERIKELRKSTQAEMIASSMRAFKKGEPAESPPEPEIKASTSYTGHQLDRRTGEADRRQSDLIRASRSIHNSIAELSEAAQSIRSHGFTIEAERLEIVIANLRSSADTITPHRPGVRA